MKIFYFAWVREKIGKDHEKIDPPEQIETISDLIDFLKTKGPEYENAFADATIIRCAINQTHVKHTTSIKDASEIAFFPPVTGG